MKPAMPKKNYSQEERKERDKLKQVREKYKLDDTPALNVRPQEIEKAVNKLVGNANDEIRQSR
jgi:hypothetical protein